MQNRRFASSVVRSAKSSTQDGVALLTTLLLMLLLTGMSIAMVLSLNSDMVMNGYYGNYRSSFYAADSGLSIAREQLRKSLQDAVNPSFASGTAPMPSGAEGTVLADLVSKFGASTVVNAASSYPQTFFVDTSTDPSTGLARTSLTLQPSYPKITNVANGQNYEYVYKYNLTVVGSAKTNQKARLNDTGLITVDVTVSNTTSYKRKFSGWGTFLNLNDICIAKLVGGTITGPQFTNGSWTFGMGESYLFTDPVSSRGANAGFYYNSSSDCVPSNSASYKKYGTTIAPTFKKGFLRGQNRIDTPSNDWNQKRAVIDGIGANDTQLSNGEMNAALRDATGTAYPATGAANGVFLPYSIDASGNKTFTGGGILVEGDASVTLTSSGSSTAGTAAQLYTIKQTYGGKTYTTTITITPPNPANTTASANTTAISTVQGSTTVGSQTISGVPKMYNEDMSFAGNGTLLYVDGNISSLAGPGGSAAAIQDGTALTVTALNNITVTDNILYKTEPVTLTASGSTAAATLISGNDKGQSLGIFTANGAVILDPATNGKTLEIDASIVATSQADSNTASCDMNTICAGTISVAKNNTIDVLTIVGGRIQNRAQSMPSGTIGTRNIIFDRRYESDGFAPPFFPSTTVTETSGTTSYSNGIQASVSRVRWTNQSVY